MRGVVQTLVLTGAVRATDVTAAMAEFGDGADLGRHLIDRRVITERQYADAVALQTGHRFVDLFTETLDPQVVALWDRPISRRGWQAAAQFWEKTPLADDGHRVDGYRLGDAYQELSADARKNRALCQTPKWVADLLLELSVVPAVDEVGADEIRMADPSCGTGHILLAAFHRIRVHQPRGRAPRAPASQERSLERALRAVHGIELDSYAAAVARYRLLATTAAILGGPITRVPAHWPEESTGTVEVSPSSGSRTAAMESSTWSSVS